MSGARTSTSDEQEMKMARSGSTKIRALREAKELLQEFGFGGFSFQHIADSLGIKKPSLYDHFKSKEALGQEIVDDYASGFKAWTRSVQDQSPREQVAGLFDIFFKFARQDRKLCPLSALLAEMNSLPRAVRKAALKAYTAQKIWLIDVVSRGQRLKIFRKDIPAESLAETVMTMALGSQLIARGNESSDCIKRVRANALKLLATEG